MEIPNAVRDSPTLVSSHFIRDRWPILVLISVVFVVPCFWHRHIIAGDLGSHTYNAWLVQLIKEGHAPGLWVKNIWQNVLFDWMLSGLSSLLGSAWVKRLQWPWQCFCLERVRFRFSTLPHRSLDSFAGDGHAGLRLDISGWIV